MQFTITVTDVSPDGTPLVFADLTVELPGIHPDVAINWATCGIEGIVGIYNDTEENEPKVDPLHKVTLLGIGVGRKIHCISLLRSVLGLNLQDAKKLADTESLPLVLKESLSAQDAMDLSDKFTEIGCTVKID